MIERGRGKRAVSSIVGRAAASGGAALSGARAAGSATRSVARAAWRHIEAWLDSERPQIPLWSPVAFGLGITLYFMLPWEAQRLAAVVVALAVAGVGTIVRGTAGRMLVWGGVLAALGVGIAAWRSADVALPVLRDRYEGDVAGTVEAVEIRSGRGQVRFQLAPDDPGLPPHVRISLKSNVPPGLVPGARVRLRAMLLPPTGPSFPGGYDFARREWFDQLGATGYPLGPTVVTRAAPPPDGAEAWLDDLRAKLTVRIEHEVGGDAGAISAAFVTGDQGGISTETNLAMRYSGMAHLLSISGVHIAIVVGGTMWVTRALLALVPWIALHWPLKAVSAGAAAVAGIGYTILAGAQVPTVRSCIGTVIVLLGVILGREALSLRLLAAGGFVIMAVRPEALLGPSFQLTFAAVTGLVALFNSRLGRWLTAPRQNAGWLSRTLQHLAALLVTGVIAEALLSATALFHFNQTGAYGVIANLLAIPWTEFAIMPVLVLALLLDPIGIAAPAWWALGKSMDALITLAVWVAGWPGSVVRLGLMPVTAYALLVGGGLWLFIWQGRARWFGAVPVAVGAVMALTAHPPNLLVSADGHHVAVLLDAYDDEGPRLALLRDRTGDFLRDVWGGVTASTADAAIADLPHGDCTVDACVARIGSGSGAIRLLATLSRDRIGQPAFGPACAAADIVVSDRRLPAWCTPHWLKLDRTALGHSGAVAIWLAPRRVETVGELTGDHPWMPQPQVWRPRAGGRSGGHRHVAVPVVASPSEPTY
jgi:competence protein ComEC